MSDTSTTTQAQSSQAQSSQAQSGQDDASRAAQEESNPFRVLLESSNDLVWILDAEHRIRYISPQVSRILGWSADVAVGERASLLVPPEELDIHASIMSHAASRTGRPVQIEFQVLRNDGSRLWVSGSAIDMRDVGPIGGVVINVRDISQQRQLEDQLAQRSLFDELTGLPTRALFLDRLDQAIQLGAHDLIVKVLLLDIDNFREINRVLGHGLADDLLRQASQRMREALPEDTMLGRYRGDQFLVARVSAESQRGELVGALNRSFSQPFKLGEKTYKVSGSIGLVTTTGETSSDEMVKKATSAMHDAKRHGPGQAVTWSAPLDARSVYRRETESELRVAIDNDELRLHFQPIMAIDSGHVAGVEALVRWEHPSRGLVPPSEFITIAEETGMIVPIGAWVLEETLTAVNELNASRTSPLMAAVNLSPRQLHDPDFVSMLTAAISRNNFDPRFVNLDITEAALEGTQTVIGDRLSRIAQMGVKLAIDDFGTGYSSLSRLRACPAAYIKVDRAFTSEIESGGEELVAGIITLAHAFGLTPIAEGVETEKELEVLRRLGCRYSQGYLHSRPLPLPALREFLGSIEGAK